MFSDNNPFYNNKFLDNQLSARPYIDPPRQSYPYNNNKWNAYPQPKWDYNYAQKPWQRQKDYSNYNYNMRGRGRSLSLIDNAKKANQTVISNSSPYPSHEDIDEDWEHHYGHRDRRDLFSILEKAINM